MTDAQDNQFSFSFGDVPLCSNVFQTVILQIDVFSFDNWSI